MKPILLVLLFVTYALAALSPEQAAKIEPISKECRTKTGATQEQISKVRTGQGFEDDPKLKKHMLCMLKKTNIVSESGDIDTDTIKRKLQKLGASDEKITEVLQCAVKKDSPEETAFDLIQCVFKKQPNFSPAD